jgi:hypothetical protein
MLAPGPKDMCRFMPQGIRPLLAAHPRMDRDDPALVVTVTRPLCTQWLLARDVGELFRAE